MLLVVEVAYGHSTVSCYVALLNTLVASLCWDSFSFTWLFAISFSYLCSFVRHSFVCFGLSNLSFRLVVHVAISFAFVANTLSLFPCWTSCLLLCCTSYLFLGFTFLASLVAPISICAGPPSPCVETLDDSCCWCRLLMAVVAWSDGVAWLSQIPSWKMTH